MSAETAPAGLKVDVVIDNYNYADFLGAAIESALGQTHEGVAVIVVDDGSTDGSRELLGAFEDRVELVLKENGGQASALNAGFERCRGDVIIFLDADDLLHPEAAARVAAAFAADDSLVKVQYRMDTIDAEGRSTGEVKPAPHLPLPNGDVRVAELTFPYDLVWMATSGNAFRTDALRRILPIPEHEYPRTGADWYLVHLAALLGPVSSLDFVGAGYRVHGANSYEAPAGELDLDQLRQGIGFVATTSRELLRLAGELGLERPERILSVADLARRLTSLRLDPQRHPIATDSPAGIVRDAGRAIRLRSDSSAAKKLLFGAWFGLMAIAPRRFARPLAELFFFPGRRPNLTGLR